MELELKSKEDLQRMRRAGQIVAEVLQRLQQEAKPGVTTLELDRIAEDMTRKRGAVPAFTRSTDSIIASTPIGNRRSK